MTELAISLNLIIRFLPSTYDSGMNCAKLEGVKLMTGNEERERGREGERERKRDEEERREGGRDRGR